MPRASVVLRRWLIMILGATASLQIRRRMKSNVRPPVLCCALILLAILRIDRILVNADCWYENDKHQEGVEVVTNEPCLNCTCNRGALLCYLRVCPRLPNPPPTGCILLHRYKSCCPELICSDIPSGNSIEGRSEIDPLELLQTNLNDDKDHTMKNACIANGSIYAPGSAMDSSTDCEYCYCLGGEQKCVKPKCLLPLDGCVPAYDTNDCCPVRYNCTRDLFTTSTTTTLAPQDYEIQGGCVVDGKFYPEGGKVLGIGHSICDNCYCLRSLVRCEPLSCASPLLGCTPVIRPGECCAASYNCSGAIETHPEPNYGQFPTVSKEYAKLRKEVQHKRTTSIRFTERPTPLNENLNIPYYVIAESTKDSEDMLPSLAHKYKNPTTRQFTATTISGLITQSPFYYNLSSSQKMNVTNVNSNANANERNEKKDLAPEIYYVPTKVTASNSHQGNVENVEDSQQQEKPSPDIYREDSLATTIRHKKYTSSSEVEKIQMLLEERVNRGFINGTTINGTTEGTPSVTPVNIETTTINNESMTTTDNIVSTTMDVIATMSGVTDLPADIETTVAANEGTPITSTASVTEREESSTPLMELVELITFRTVSNSTDCVTISNTTRNETAQLEHRHGVDEDEDNKISTTETLITTEITNLETTTIDEGTSTVPADTTFSTDEATTTTDEPTTTEINSEGKSNIATVPPNTKFALESILHLNIANKSADYDYDYTAPTLPPSLPNLRIIPFVAADALDSKKDTLKNNNVYAQEENFPFSNHFSPPAETEGGFIPKEPPIIIDHFYDDYHTTNGGSNSVTSVPPIPALTNPPKSDENNCIVDGKEAKHGDSVTSEGNCALCVCFFGSIVCHEPQCPIPRTGCRNTNNIDRSTCCPEIICSTGTSSDVNESPTVVLDRLEITSKPQEVITVAGPVVPADPFRDVIRTEPAPDLQLLIGDMSNYLLKQSTTSTTTNRPSDGVLIPAASAKTPLEHATSVEDQNELSFNKIWDMLFNAEHTNSERTKQQATTTTTSTTTERSISELSLQIKTANHNFIETRENIGDNLVASKRQEHVPALLKLAGCNIYGRMYRVGRIISELSGPCMECKCTEVGVQCENLKC